MVPCWLWVEYHNGTLARVDHWVPVLCKIFRANYVLWLLINSELKQLFLFILQHYSIIDGNVTRIVRFWQRVLILSDRCICIHIYECVYIKHKYIWSLLDYFTKYDRQESSDVHTIHIRTDESRTNLWVASRDEAKISIGPSVIWIVSDKWNNSTNVFHRYQSNQRTNDNVGSNRQQRFAQTEDREIGGDYANYRHRKSPDNSCNHPA